MHPVLVRWTARARETPQVQVGQQRSNTSTSPPSSNVVPRITAGSRSPPAKPSGSRNRGSRPPLPAMMRTHSAIAGESGVHSAAAARSSVV